MFQFDIETIALTVSKNVLITLTHFYVNNYIDEFENMSVGVSHVRLQILYHNISFHITPL